MILPLTSRANQLICLYSLLSVSTPMVDPQMTLGLPDLDSNFAILVIETKLTLESTPPDSKLI